MRRSPLFILALALILGGCYEVLPSFDDAPNEAPSKLAVRATQATPETPAPLVQTAPRRVTPSVAPAGATAFIEDERNTITVFDKVAPATVFVTQSQLVRTFHSSSPTEVPVGSGTGFIWDDEGHIVTNYHVIDGGSSFSVTLFNQKSYSATLVGGEPRKDIAVLKIDAPKNELIAIRLPSIDTPVTVGQKAVAIGNPYGLDHTLTTGVISAIDREMKGFGGVTIRDMVQTDASINPGNSGGPLLDSSGQLIGMNTMIFSKSGASAGIGFAVPGSTVRRMVPQIIKTGKAEQVGLGVSILSDRVASRWGIKGVVIQEVTAGSPAAEAGIEGLVIDRSEVTLGDVIVKIDGDDVANYDHLYNALEGRSAGEKVDVTLIRAGKVRVVPVELYLLR